MRDLRRKGTTENAFGELIAANQSPEKMFVVGDRVGCPGCLRKKPRWFVYQDVLTCSFCEGRFHVVKVVWPPELLSENTVKLCCSWCHHSIYKVFGDYLECCYCHEKFGFDGGLTVKPLDFIPKKVEPRKFGGFSRSSIYRALKQADQEVSK